MRGILVALLIATPSLLLPGYASDATEMVVLAAILASILTIVEYASNYPSFIEFRDAPPLNRIRFISLFVMVFILTIVCKHALEPTNLTAVFDALGRLAGNMLDFPYSPVRLILSLIPHSADQAMFDAIKMTAGTSYLIALLSVLFFYFTIRILGWPIGAGAFNVWTNLPLFDPTTGGDVVHRLYRDGRVNVILGVLLPFLIPALIKLAAGLFDPFLITDPQTLIWTMSAWAFLPASMAMRGMAMLRIADLIEEKRRRTYANAEAVQTA